MKDLKYIPKDYLQDFLVGMSKYDTETLLTDLSVCELLDGKIPEDHNPIRNTRYLFYYRFKLCIPHGGL